MKSWFHEKITCAPTNPQNESFKATSSKSWSMKTFTIWNSLDFDSSNKSISWVSFFSPISSTFVQITGVIKITWNKAAAFILTGFPASKTWNEVLLFYSDFMGNWAKHFSIVVLLKNTVRKLPNLMYEIFQKISWNQPFPIW